MFKVGGMYIDKFYGLFIEILYKGNDGFYTIHVEDYGVKKKVSEDWLEHNCIEKPSQAESDECEHCGGGGCFYCTPQDFIDTKIL